jgi:hypothetical protein
VLFCDPYTTFIDEAESAMQRHRHSAALAILLATALPTVAVAALAPHYQRAREFTAVVEVATPLLDFMPIDAVERIDRDLFRVRAGACTLDVRIVDLPQSATIVGPRRFSVEPGERICE